MARSSATPKKDGRMSPEMPVKNLRFRFVYEGPSYIYGEWVNLADAMKLSMFPNEDYPVAYVEFDTKQG